MNKSTLNLSKGITPDMPKHITCRINGILMTTIYCDGQIEFPTNFCIPLYELTQIKIISENFNLFYDNI